MKLCAYSFKHTYKLVWYITKCALRKLLPPLIIKFRSGALLVILRFPFFCFCGALALASRIGPTGYRRPLSIN